MCLKLSSPFESVCVCVSPISFILMNQEEYRENITHVMTYIYIPAHRGAQRAWLTIWIPHDDAILLGF